MLHINDDYDDNEDYDIKGNVDYDDNDGNVDYDDNGGNVDYDDNDGNVEYDVNDDVGQPLAPTVLALCLRSSHEV